MVDFIAFNEGKTELAANGLPAMCHFFLSTKGVDAGTAHTVGETLAAADLGEIAGTGAARKSQAEPAPVNGVVTFALMSWNTGAATNWPASVRSIVLATGAAAAGKAICAWNLLAGGAARDLSAPNTTENVTPILNVGEGMATEQGVPLGTIMPYAGSTAPSDTRFLLCDGAFISRSTYSELFTLIGTTYGAGDGSTTFNLPDLRGRVPVGVDGIAARLTANDALGNSGGAEKHTLISSEIPDHQHAISVWDNSGFGGALAIHAQATGHVTQTHMGTGPWNGSTLLPDGGGDLPHNNMQPHLTTQFICRVL